ncbi:DUF4328 domain-containing protein [Tabrizicola sp.]|uniref:DUF4328 domain-containing protein n=1 Tax=Tabrizicola sp. TaxID=2005166 RepID=UPI003F3DF0CE
MQDKLKYELDGLARTCVALVWVVVATEVVYAANSLYYHFYIGWLEAGTIGDAEADQIETATMVVGFAYLGVFVVSGLFCCTWIYRASWNARQIHPTPERITPGWSVGWFFIPILSLWKPYEAMKQTWNSSHNPGDDIRATLPSFAGYWWASWVVSSLLGNLSFRLWRNAETLADYRFANIVDLITSPISLLSSVLFIRLIKSITEAQRDRRPGSGLQEIFA